MGGGGGGGTGYLHCELFALVSVHADYPIRAIAVQVAANSDVQSNLCSFWQRTVSTVVGIKSTKTASAQTNVQKLET